MISAPNPTTTEDPLIRRRSSLNETRERENSAGRGEDELDARSLGSDKEFQPNIDGACLMRLSGIDEVSKVVSVIEVEGGKERKRGTGKRH